MKINWPINAPKQAGPGFTLIELLVVIAIIGLLASIVLVALNGARQKSRDAARIADVKQIASAMELFFNNYNTYPTLPVLASDGGYAAQYLTPTFLGSWPIAPTPADGTGANLCTANSYPHNNAFIYSLGANSSSYNLTFCLGGLTGSYAAGEHTLTQSGIQ